MTLADSRYTHSSPLSSAGTWTADQRFNNDVLLTFGTTNGTDWDFSHDGSDMYLQSNTGGLTIGLAASPPAPDNDGVHIWKATAGSITSQANSLLTLENDAQAVITFLTPNDDSSGIEFGDPENNAIGRIIYNHATDGLLIKVANSNQAIWTDGALALQKATTISTTADGLTLDPANGDLTIDAHLVFGSARTFTVNGALTLAPTSADVLITDGSGLVVGHTVQITVDAHIPEFQVLGTGQVDSGAVLLRSSANAYGPALYFAKARDAIGTFTTDLSADDILGAIRWSGSDGGDANLAGTFAEISAEVDAAAAGSDDMPGRLVFKTTPDGARVPVKRLSISNAGVATFSQNVVLEKAAVLKYSELTIASGVITVTSNYHTIDTEETGAGSGAGDPTDNLDTISGGQIGQFLILQAAASARDVTLKNGTGNIFTRDGNDVTMTSTITPLMLIFDNGSTWRVVGGQAGL